MTRSSLQIRSTDISRSSWWRRWKRPSWKTFSRCFL